MRQVRLNIDTTFSENKSAAIGVKYLNLGEIPVRTGIELSISCLLAPIGDAVLGASLSKVKDRVEISRTIFETYMNLALSRAECNEKSLANETKVEAKAELVTADVNQSESEEEALTEINFDDEEF